MGVMVNLRPEIEAGLRAKAAQAGKSLEEYLVWITEQFVPPKASTPPAFIQSTEEWLAVWKEFTRTNTSLATNADDSRETIYEGRRVSILVDTNVLARAAEPLHAMFQVAEQAAINLRLQGETLCIVPQVLYEFWSVGTRPLSANGLGLSIPQAEGKVAQIMTNFHLLEETTAVLAEGNKLVVQHQVIGKNAHDAHLVAAMIAHGLGRILTFNTQDFQRFPNILALSPEDVVKAIVP